MTKKTHWLRLLLPLAIASTLVGCDDAPTTALVENQHPVTADGGAGPETLTVFKAWWVTTLFASPVAPGATSETERIIPASDFAYALLAPGWSPDDGGAPPRLIALKSASKLSVAEHALLRIPISDDQFVGNCAAGKALSADDARLIVERIFPGDFAGMLYDPATCTTTSTSGDGPAD